MKEGAFSIPVPFRHAVGIPLWKRLLDLLCICAALPVLAPLMALIAVGIKLISRGPALFKQERIGYRGMPFTCFKFRTMKVDAAVIEHQKHLEGLIEGEAPMVKMDQIGDSRLFPFASILRATGLDELPQIFNVLRGEMSLVGPRPCLPYEYDNHLPWQKSRYNTLPGLTGLWQVSGKNRTTFNQMVELDLTYTSHLSLWSDLKIMFRTVPVLLLQLGELVTNRRKNKQVKG